MHGTVNFSVGFKTDAVEPRKFYFCFDIVGFFIPGFPKLMRFQEHFDAVIKKFLPKLRKHIVRIELTTTMPFQCLVLEGQSRTLNRSIVNL